MENRILEIVLSSDGRYMSANDDALEALGYTLDELKLLDLGALSNFPEQIAQKAWRMVIDGELTVTGDQPTELRRKDGSPFHAVVLGIDRSPEGHFVSRLQPRPGAAPIDRTLHNVLAEWRRAERELAQAAEPDLDVRSRLEGEIERLRNEYQLIARERQEAPA
jgi:PAS domain-containing protein